MSRGAGKMCLERFTSKKAFALIFSSIGYGMMSMNQVFSRFLRITLITGVMLGGVFIRGGDLAMADPPAEKAATAANETEESSWKDLNIRPDGSWVQSRFGGDGKLEIADGVISLGFGDPLTGVRWEGDFPKIGYEISLEARRTNGFDFFCGLTLPVGDQRCSLILGGWGGSLVGLSSIDGMDAAHNETMLVREFEQNRWYKVRMEVTEKRLRVWLDDEQIIDFERDGRPLDIRSEMEQSTPVGVAAFQCQSQIKNVRVRLVDQTAQAAEKK